MMSLRRLNFMNWPISTKLTAIFLLAVLLPALLIVVPFSAQRRSTMLREQNKVRLETLGPSEIAQTELALNALSTALERLAADPDDYSELEQFFYMSPRPSVTDQMRQQLDAFATQKTNQFMNAAPSLSRVRLYDATGNLLVDTTKFGGVVHRQYEETAQTPANLLIESGQVGRPTSITDIYLDARGNPSLDVIYTLRPLWDPGGTAPIIGQIVFTQDLLLAPDDRALPDLYALIQNFPQSEQSTAVYLLDSSGRLLTPSNTFEWLYDASTSKGFQQAERGESGVSSYHSPFLHEEVLGYHAAVTFPDGPQLTYLIETPLDEITQQAVVEGVVTLLWAGLGSLALGLFSIFLGTVVIARPLQRLTEAARQITAGRLDISLPTLARRDEIGVLNNAFGEMAGQLLNAIRELEHRVAERTQNLELTLEVGRVLTSIRDRDTLLDEVVNLIRDRFDKIYHAQIFLIDPQTDHANLRASTGAPGRALLQRGHYLEVGSQSVIGSVTATGQAVVALDTSHNPIHKRNEFLPDTRAEMALPLRIGSRIIGALDLQSALPDAFTEQDVELFQGMADQITVAIENATLFDESTARLLEIERLNRSLTEAAWREVGHHRAPETFSAAAGLNIQPADGWTALQLEAMRTGQIVDRVEGDRVTFAVPVLLREQVMGAIEWQMPHAGYTNDARQTALELSTRLALAAENIRLFEQSIRAVQREQLVNQISSKVTGTTDIDQILQTAVRELGLALRTSQTIIQIAPRGQLSGENDQKDTQKGAQKDNE
jgi:GAF domain-containing protein/HAMP domain-containing protein